jgi:hypothetical protein
VSQGTLHVCPSRFYTREGGHVLNHTPGDVDTESLNLGFERDLVQVPWLTTVIQLLRRQRLEGSQFKASQGKKVRETLISISWVWWCAPVIPDIEEMVGRRL